MIWTGHNQNTRRTACIRAAAYTASEGWRTCELCVKIDFTLKRTNLCPLQGPISDGQGNKGC
jgi:hypothetical protein